MERYLIYGITAFCTVAMSCTDTDTLQENVSYENELQLASIQTSSTIDAVNVYVADKDGAAYITEEGKVTSLIFKKSSSGGWASGEKVDITTEKGEASIYACYPSTETINNENTSPYINIKVLKGSDSEPLDFSAGAQTDYLYATPVKATQSNRSVSLTMQHALAKVSFCVKKEKDVTEEIILTNLVIQSGGSLLQSGEGVMQLKDGGLNGLVSTSSITLQGSVKVDMNQSSPNVTCLVAPMNAKEAVLSFTLTVNGRSFSTASISPAVQWVAGNHYVYNITIKKIGGTLSGMQIIDWRNDASQNTVIGI